MVDRKKYVNIFGVILQNEEKLSDHARVSISSNEEPSIQNKSEAAIENLSFLKENRVSKNNQGKRAQKLEEEKDEVKDDDHKSPPKVGTDDHAVQTESLATVSWKLPHRKRGEQQPGFNLDYDPPRTHPPVHN